MGFSSQVQQPQTSGGKGSGPSSVGQMFQGMGNDFNKASPTGQSGLGAALGGFGSEISQQPQVSSSVYQDDFKPHGKGASGQRFTYSPTSGQPSMGSPNQYTNTVGQWDNASVMPQPVQQRGKGGKS